MPQSPVLSESLGATPPHLFQLLVVAGSPWLVEAPHPSSPLPSASPLPSSYRDTGHWIWATLIQYGPILTHDICKGQISK